MPNKRDIPVLARFGHVFASYAHVEGTRRTPSPHSGLDRIYLAGIECGERNVALRSIEAIAKGLEITLQQ